MATYSRVAKAFFSVGLGIAVSPAALADDGYHPYYLQRDYVGFSHVAPPIEDGIAKASVIDPGKPTPWQPAQVTLNEPVPPQPSSLAVTPPPQPETQNDAVPRKGGADLGTRPGFSIGGEVSNYHYQEHDVPEHQFMRMDGLKYGIDVSASATFDYGLFLTGQFRFAGGENSYFSDPTGKISNFAPDYLGDGRILVGDDLFIHDGERETYDFSPYVGFGIRDLYNDSSAIAGGYRRNSQYFYLPVGLTQRFPLWAGRLSINSEYDHLLLGRQTSYLGDVYPGFPAVTENQNHGFGLRGSVMYELQHWSFGPFVEYWNINESDQDILAEEPHNQTWEYGGKISYRFK